MSTGDYITFYEPWCDVLCVVRSFLLTLHFSAVAIGLKIQFLFLYANYTLQNLEENIGLVRGKGK